MHREYIKNAWLRASLLLVLGLTAPALAVVTPDGPPGRERKYRPDELLVKFRPGVGASEAEAHARAAGAREAREFRRPRKLQSAPIDAWRLVRLGPGADLERVPSTPAAPSTPTASSPSIAGGCSPARLGPWR